MGILDWILDEIFDENWVGRRGEKLTEKELKWVSFFGRKGYTLRNIYIPKDNGETSEIDLVYITQKGIFVFESKNYSGWIFGDEESLNWTACLPNGQKFKFYNPVSQNRSHIIWLKEFIGANVPLFSIIVFSERCTLKKVSVESPDVRVIKRDKTYRAVSDIWDNSPDKLTDEEVKQLFDKLEALTKVDESVKLSHIENIKSRHNTQQGQYNIASKFNSMRNPEMVCPLCGRKLVIRTARRGKNAGNQFYGCSGYPYCKFISNW